MRADICAGGDPYVRESSASVAATLRLYQRGKCCGMVLVAIAWRVELGRLKEPTLLAQDWLDLEGNLLPGSPLSAEERSAVLRALTPVVAAELMRGSASHSRVE